MVKRHLACLAILLSTLHGPVHADSWLQLADQPAALGWTAAEIEAATLPTGLSVIDRARREGRLGCAQACGRLQRVFARLVPVARQQTPRAESLPWRLTVVRVDDVDAMALPDGQLLISEYFVQHHARTDAELAFVLAHEMAHSILEHERQLLTAARALLPRDVQRSVADMYVELDLNFALVKSLEVVLQHGEFEADELGLLLASVAGYEPQAQLAFIEHEAARAQRPQSLVQTHPTAQQRMLRLRDRLPLARRLHLASAPTRS